MQTSNDLIDKYKRHPFAAGLLPFSAALKALDSPWPRIYAKSQGNQRWVFYDKKTKQPALFSHAAVLVASDHQETGNYVPDGQAVPFGVEAKTVQKRPNAKCSYTYIFDTYSDMSLYEGQWTLDDHMRGLDGFNPGQLPRRPYLSGQDPKYRNRFWMQTPMFLRRGAQDERSAAPSHLHPWVVRADTESKGFRANPDRPRVWVKVDNEILPIADRTPNCVQRGDTVAISFTVTYHVTAVNWFAQFHPADVVVLKAGEADGPDYSAPALGLHDRPPPSFDTNVMHDDTAINCQYNDDDDQDVESGTMVNGMEGIEVGGSEASDQYLQLESMEVDEGIESGSSSDGLVTLSGVLDSGDIDDFDVVARGEGEVQSVDEFIDIMAEEEGEEEEEDIRPTRAGSSRNGRSGRKRN